MSRLTIQAAVNTFTGYGQLFCEVFAGLEKLGVFCSVRSIEMSEPFGAVVPVEIKSRVVQCPQPEPWELIIRNPNHLPTPGKKTVYFTMYESTILPKDWVSILNQATIVVVPCQWNARHFAESGVTVPIHVIPLGVSPEIFNYMPAHEDGVFRVGVAGRVAHGPVRKGIQSAIDVFMKAFHSVDNVELLVKVHPDCEVKKTDDRRVKIIREHMQWHQVRKWFSSIDVFLSMARAEGFGLWQLQAMACGRPVIAAAYGGLADFLTEQSSYLLPFVEQSIPELGLGKWAEIDEQAAIRALLRAYSDFEEQREKGRLSAMAASRLTWDHTVRKLHHLLMEVGAL